MKNENLKIKVDSVSVRFNQASEKVDNLKEYAIKLMKHQLMFREFFALKNISFEIMQGESWGIIGTNGSGKSTLLKTISGIIKPFQGTVEVNGVIAPLIELGAGFDHNLTARENIYLNGCILGYSEKYIRQHFDEIVEFAELEDFLELPIKNYSSGMSARLGFSIATFTKPDILIVDEILSVGDYKFQKKCQKRMEELLSEGTTLLYVSHNAEEIKARCQKVLWLEKGQIKMSGSAELVCEAYLQES